MTGCCESKKCVSVEFSHSFQLMVLPELRKARVDGNDIGNADATGGTIMLQTSPRWQLKRHLSCKDIRVAINGVLDGKLRVFVANLSAIISAIG